MRRVLAIGLAIVVVMIVARGAMAQDSDQTVSNRLLEILKDRQIITQDEYGELKALAESMQEDRAEVDRRLTDLDRSISDYLAKDGDAVGANVSYTKGRGFGFSSGDGLFALNVGGLFQFSFLGWDTENARDTNNFDVEENRVILQGHFFDQNLQYYTEFDGDGSSFMVMDAYVDYNLCDYTTLRFGQFKIPNGRQNLTHESDRAFADRGPVAAVFNLDRDVGAELHHVQAIQEGQDAVFEYAVGIWNGEGRYANGNDNNWLAWGGRAGIYPLGFVDYVEGDLEGSQDPKFGIAGSYYAHKNAAGTDFDQWEFDGVLTWNGLFVLGEYFDNSTDPDKGDTIDNDGWYAQAGYMIQPGQLEVVGRYGTVDYDRDSMLDELNEWSVGLVYYWDGHHLKAGVNAGQLENKYYVERGMSYDKMDKEDIDTNFIRIWFQLEW